MGLKQGLQECLVSTLLFLYLGPILGTQALPYLLLFITVSPLSTHSTFPFESLFPMFVPSAPLSSKLPPSGWDLGLAMRKTPNTATQPDCSFACCLNWGTNVDEVTIVPRALRKIIMHIYPTPTCRCTHTPMIYTFRHVTAVTCLCSLLRLPSLPVPSPSLLTPALLVFDVGWKWASCRL